MVVGWDLAHHHVPHSLPTHPLPLGVAGPRRRAVPLGSFLLLPTLPGPSSPTPPERFPSQYNTGCRPHRFLHQSSQLRLRVTAGPVLLPQRRALEAELGGFPLGSFRCSGKLRAGGRVGGWRKPHSRAGGWPEQVAPAQFSQSWRAVTPETTRGVSLFPQGCNFLNLERFGRGEEVNGGPRGAGGAGHTGLQSQRAPGQPPQPPRSPCLVPPSPARPRLASPAVQLQVSTGVSGPPPGFSPTSACSLGSLARRTLLPSPAPAHPGPRPAAWSLGAPTHCPSPQPRVADSSPAHPSLPRSPRSLGPAHSLRPDANACSLAHMAHSICPILAADAAGWAGTLNPARPRPRSPEFRPHPAP